MFNLLLLRDKIFLLKEYRFRVLIVGLFLVSVSLGIGAVLLIPSYISSRMELANANVELATFNQADHAPQTNFGNTLSDAATYVNLLSTDTSAHLTAVIQKIIAVKESGISLSGIEYTLVSTSTATAQISGLADTRQNLLDFGDALKKDPQFSGVNIPLSNFVKDDNLQFSLQFNIKLK